MKFRKILAALLAALMLAAVLVTAAPAFSAAEDPVDVGPDRWSYASVKYAMNNNYMTLILRV